MKKLLLTAIFCCAITTPPLFADLSWGYSSSNGPATWGNHFPDCKPGGSQTPVDIETNNLVTVTNHAPLKFYFGHTANTIVNNGHTFQIIFPSNSSTVVIGKTKYQILQLHFHSPSENTVNKAHFPVEMHIEALSPEKKLTVIAVFFKSGAMNSAIAALWKHLPDSVGNSISLAKTSIDYGALLPNNLNYDQLEGSLTTPPCTHGLTWRILKTPMTMSSAQIAQLRKYYDGNNRPIQALPKGAAITTA